LQTPARKRACPESRGYKRCLVSSSNSFLFSHSHRAFSFSPGFSPVYLHRQSRKPFKRFSAVLLCVTTGLKPGVNETSCYFVPSFVALFVPLDASVCNVR